MYAHVENGVVDYVGRLPKNWSNISGLNLSEGDATFLKPLGWLPAITTEITPSSEQVRDTDQFTIENDRVIVVQRVRSKTNEEIATDWLHLRMTRNQKLLECDWTDLTNVPLTSDKKTEWATYRQSLRDLPATADMTTWPDNFIWPTEPE